MTSIEKIENGEYAKKVLDAIQAFAALDAACEKVKERGICDAIGVKCDIGCQLYVKKDAYLKFLESAIRSMPSAPAEVVSSEVAEERPRVEEKPIELRCPSCGSALRDAAKFCDLCGEEIE